MAKSAPMIAEDPTEEAAVRSALSEQLHKARLVILAAVRRVADSPATYGAGEFVLHQGQIADAGFVVEHGRVKVGCVMEDGLEIVLRVARQGDFVGLAETLIAIPHTRYARALTDSLLWRLERARIDDLLNSDREFARAMLMIPSVRSLEWQLNAAKLRAGPVRSRLVHLLMKLANETDLGCHDGNVIPLELGQEEMASIIGTTRQSVSSLLNLLKHDGLIHTHERMVQVPRWDAVLSWAESGGNGAVATLPKQRGHSFRPS